MTRVAILGGGMAGLAAAWRLSRPDGTQPEITVYQRGWRLGGKGASSRGRHDRIQEHGLHVWLGHYDNAFRLMRECYGELDRARSDPHCPIQGVWDAFFPASTIGVGEFVGDDWSSWISLFPENNLLPGEGKVACDPDGTDVGWDEDGLLPSELALRLSSLVAMAGSSMASHPPPTRAVLSPDPRPPLVDRPGLVDGVMAGMSALADSEGRRRVTQFGELVTVMLRGIVADRLHYRGYDSIDHLDFREWLAIHGASNGCREGPLVRAMYDLVFAYADGDTSRPQFAAGTAVHLATRMFFAYRGAIFWKMRAGMGETVFAPLYQALVRRGVRFEFFHRITALHPSADHSQVESVSLERQVRLRRGLSVYQPLVSASGLPVFPEWPDPAQLDAERSVVGHDLESHWVDWAGADSLELRAGRDFDVAVLATSLGMIPHICRELVETDDRWRLMTEHVRTVATQSVQLWLDTDERALGWRDRSVVMTQCGEPLDTFASMSHTLPFEAWPVTRRPRTAAALCGVLADDRVVDSPVHDSGTPHNDLQGTSETKVREGFASFMDGPIRRVWPNFRPEQLIEGVDGQYFRSNTDPSDRYVQSLPGTGHYRLRADASGFANLVLAGDWTDNGLNAGCIEAATLSGLQAANAVEGADLTAGTTTFRPRSTGLVQEQPVP